MYRTVLQADAHRGSGTLRYGPPNHILDQILSLEGAVDRRLSTHRSPALANLAQNASGVSRIWAWGIHRHLSGQDGGRCHQAHDVQVPFQ